MVLSSSPTLCPAFKFLLLRSARNFQKVVFYCHAKTETDILDVRERCSNLFELFSAKKPKIRFSQLKHKVRRLLIESDAINVSNLANDVLERYFEEEGDAAT